jgi:hypothetical protein
MFVRKNKMKVIYISGKYRDARGEYYVGQNIIAAENAAIQVWKLGGAAICPHKNTSFLGGVCPDDVWLEGDLELVCRSDALWMIDGWEESEGARAERIKALLHGKDILYSYEEVVKYLRRKNE